MSLVQKEYFRLEEVAGDLGLSGSDVIYLAENGQLRLSIRVLVWRSRGAASRIMVMATGTRFQTDYDSGRVSSIFGSGTPMRS